MNCDAVMLMWSDDNITIPLLAFENVEMKHVNIKTRNFLQHVVFIRS